MYETFTTVVGTIISDPKRRAVGEAGDEVFSFRVGAHVRRLDRATGQWKDGAKLYVTVSCWNRMVQNVAATLAKGDPVIAFGELATTSYTGKDGEQRSGLELRARSIGPDLGRCQATVTRRAAAKRDPDADLARDGDTPPGAAATAPADGPADLDAAYLDAVVTDDPGEDPLDGDGPAEHQRYAA